MYKISVSVDKIIDLAFIFSLDDMEDDVTNFFGISNCYLLRHQIDKGKHEPIQHFVKFPCESDDYMCCTSSVAKIWYDICSIQDVMWKIMNTESERQHTSVRVPVQIDEMTLEYIRYRCAGETNKILLNSRRKRRSMTLKGMKRKTRRAKRRLYLLRFETEASLIRLRQIIGESCTIGVRRRRPKIDTGDRLEFNNTINLIVGFQEDATNKRSDKQYINNESIDFCRDEFDSYIVVRYDSYNYNSSGVTNENKNHNYNSYVTNILSGIDEMESNEREEENAVRIGQIMNRDDDAVMIVTYVNDEYAVLKYIEPYEQAGIEIRESDLELLHNQICEYNS